MPEWLWTVIVAERISARQLILRRISFCVCPSVTYAAHSCSQRRAQLPHYCSRLPRAMTMRTRRLWQSVSDDILEASRPRAKVQCRVTGLFLRKTSKNSSYFDSVHIDARVVITVHEKNAKTFLHTFTMGDVAQKT